MKRIRFLFITTLFVMIGLVTGISPASANSITVESVSYSTDSATANVTKESRAVINGASQVTWEVPNHNWKITATQIKRAPKISTSCTSSNRFTQSKQIWNKTHRAIVVVGHHRHLQMRNFSMLSIHRTVDVIGEGHHHRRECP